MQNHRHGFGMDWLDKRIWFAGQKRKSIAFIEGAPDTSERRDGRFIDLEPTFLSPRLGLGFGELREGHEAAIFSLCEHRSPEGAG